MGTHPIFESDFDCLTVSKKKNGTLLCRSHSGTLDLETVTTRSFHQFYEESPIEIGCRGDTSESIRQKSTFGGGNGVSRISKACNSSRGEKVESSSSIWWSTG